MKFSAHLVFLGIGLMPLCALADPVGMAANVKGNVTVSEGGKKTPLRLLERLEPGSVVRCGPNSSAVIVLFKNGQRFQIGANQEAKVEAANLAGGQRMAAMSGPSSEAVQLLGRAKVGAILARLSPSPQRLNPKALPYLEGPTPTFTWIAKPGIAKYTFTLFDQGNNVVWSTTTSKNTATYPADAFPLTEKQAYIWRLSSFGDSGKPVESSWGIITILSAQDIRELESITTKLRADAATATDTTPLLLLAATYSDFGVLNGVYEILTEYPLSEEPGVTEATASLIESLGPYAQVLAGQEVPANAMYGGVAPNSTP